MNRKKQLGILQDLYADPLSSRVASSSEFSVVSGTPLTVALQLRERKLDAALISPLEYAREGSLYRIIAGIAVSSSVPTSTVSLIFRKGARKIGTLAADPSYTSEIILAKIILAEEFDSDPQIVPRIARSEEALAGADAALLVGDASLRQSSQHRDLLDLVEAWQELSGLPFVHSLWCGRERSLDTRNRESIVRAHDEGIAALSSIASSAAARHNLPGHSDAALTEYLQSFRYELTSEMEDGIQEFLRYAYYHGVLPDVADLHFYPGPGEEEEEDSEPSLN